MGKLYINKKALIDLDEGLYDISTFKVNLEQGIILNH
jgi:hypothetical protein